MRQLTRDCLANCICPWHHCGCKKSVTVGTIRIVRNANQSNKILSKTMCALGASGKNKPEKGFWPSKCHLGVLCAPLGRALCPSGCAQCLSEQAKCFQDRQKCLHECLTCLQECPKTRSRQPKSLKTLCFPLFFPCFSKVCLFQLDVLLDCIFGALGSDLGTF